MNSNSKQSFYKGGGMATHTHTRQGQGQNQGQNQQVRVEGGMTKISSKITNTPPTATTLFPSKSTPNFKGISRQIPTSFQTQTTKGIPTSFQTQTTRGMVTHQDQQLSYSKTRLNQSRNVLDQYMKIIETKNMTDSMTRESLKKLRLLVLEYGIPQLQTRHGSLRSCVWKLLLSVYHIDAVEYSTFLSNGPHPSFEEKIRNDVFRTLASDVSFTQKVPHSTLTRLLTAFIWKTAAQPKNRLINLIFGYVQGMNVLCAPFLFVMPELEAFACFTNFILYSCPLYVQPALEGVHMGVKLFTILLQTIDPKLESHLSANGASPQIFSFAWIMTFSACTPPLDQVIKLWDFYLAYGIHLHIFTLLYVVTALKPTLMASENPMRLLQGRNMNLTVQAKEWINGTMDMLEKCPEDLYELVIRHTNDPSVYEIIMDL